jgi:hypothetical protein
MDIKAALDHPWIQKYNNDISNLRRNSKEVSSFKVYSSTEEKN